MMKRRQFVKGRLRNSRGFTLIEIIAVLVILVIVSAVVISRGMVTDEAKLQAEVDTLKGHLRYAQYLAMNANEGNVPTVGTIKWGIRVDSSSYTLIKDVNGTQTSPFNLPNESSATHSVSTATRGGTGVELNAVITSSALIDSEYSSVKLVTDGDSNPDIYFYDLAIYNPGVIGEDGSGTVIQYP